MNIRLLYLIVSQLFVMQSGDFISGCFSKEIENKPVTSIEFPIQQKGRPVIHKVGTIDVAEFAEHSFVMFKGKLYGIRQRWPYPSKGTTSLFLQFEEYESGKKLPPFGHGYAFGRSFVKEDSVYVSATFGIGRSNQNEVYLLSSADMTHWKSRKIISTPDWFIFSSPMCQAKENQYIMMHDVYGSPSEGLDGAYCRFSVSRDMVSWEVLPFEYGYYREDNFAAGHYIDFVDGYYYNLYLGLDSTNGGWSTSIVRSTDLKYWETSPYNPVLRASSDDYKLAHKNFNSMQIEQINQLNETNNINNADVSLVEDKGKVIIYYFTGNQSNTAPCTLAKAIYEGTKAQFFKSWFPDIEK